MTQAESADTMLTDCENRMIIERFGEHDVLLTFKEAAELLRVSRATMYRLLGSGRLVGHKVGRGWRFYKADVHRFVVSQAMVTSDADHHEAPSQPHVE